MLEFLGARASQIPIQFFGTDVSEISIAKARAGDYPKNISSDVSAGRLRAFFNEVDEGYRVSRTIREMCIFAQHNLLNAPPFSHMDLICCRNLLIYMEPLLQNKVLALFHYALQPHGFLVLGISEGVGTSANLFSPEYRPHRIYSRKSTAGRQPGSFSLNASAERAEYGTVHVPVVAPELVGNYLEAQKEFDRRILKQYSPATVFVNQEMEIIHTRGNVERYLKLAPGRASLNLEKMAREGLVVELRKAVARARKENEVVGKRNLQLKDVDEHSDEVRTKRSTRFVNFDVIPIRLGSLEETYLMIVFQESHTEPAGKVVGHTEKRASRYSSERAVRLEQELGAMKEYLQSVIETLEATNEELQSANEEILSSNEELQSTNEEMETAKEELQSTNEELTTLNDELRSRNVEVTQVNSDLTNLLSSIDIAVIMIANDLTIRRFTPKAQKFLGLISTDVGRPLFNINPTIEITNLQAMVVQVMVDFRVLEAELTDRMGVRYQLKVLPYRSLNNKIDGAVITIVDIAAEDKKAGSASTE